MKITRRQLRRLILQEVRIKPDVTDISSQHLDKIHRLIDMGDPAQAQSLIDAFGGPSDYVDDYMAYQEVGDLEKLGNEASAILSEPGYSYDDVQAVDDRARAIARKNRAGFEDQNDRLDAFYQSYYDRYAKNRNKAHLSVSPQHHDPKVFLEHRIKPNIPNLPVGMEDDFLGKIDTLARNRDFRHDADSLAHSFDYPEDRSYSADLEDYEVSPHTFDMTDFDAEVFKLRRSGLDDMEIAKTIAAKTGLDWDELMYDIMMVK